MAPNFELEEGFNLKLEFGKISQAAFIGQPLLPVVAQDANTKEVLIMAYTNQEAFDYTLKTRVAAFWSTSRNSLWIKGASSGDFLDVQEIRINCEQNALLYLVSLRGKGACHTRDTEGQARLGCFYRKFDLENRKLCHDKQ